MSLQWNCTKCANSKALCEGMEWPITNCLIMLTMVVGFGEITEKNAEEFFLRVNELENINGAFLYKASGPDQKPQEEPITLAMIKARIGMTTNVSDVSKAQWTKKVATMLRDNAQRKLRAEKEEVETAVAA